jgi:hypothetical protein
MPITDVEQVLTTGLAAKSIGVTRARIWQMIAIEKILPATLVVDRYYVNPQDLVPFMPRADEPRRGGRPRTGVIASGALPRGGEQ